MKIIERATVVAVEKGRARLAISRPDDGSECGGCPAAHSCGGNPPAGGKAGARLLSVEARPDVKAGDEVTLMIEGPSPALAALLLLFLPLGAAVASGLAAYAASRSPALGLLGGLAGVTVVYLALYLTRSKHRARVEIVPTGTAGGAPGAASDDANGAPGP